MERQLLAETLLGGNSTSNFTSNSRFTLDVNTYLAIYLCILFFLLIPILLVNIPMLIVFAVAKNFAMPVRLCLLNSLASNLTLVVAVAVRLASNLVLLLNPQYQSSYYLVNRIVYYLSAFSGLVFACSLALFSVVVYLFVKHDRKKLRICTVALSVILVWIILLVAFLPFLFGAFTAQTFMIDGRIVEVPSTTGLSLLGVIIFAVEILSKVVVVCFTVAIVVYVKRNTFSEGEILKKAMVRFLVALCILSVSVMAINITVFFLRALSTNSNARRNIGSSTSSLIALTVVPQLCIFLPTFISPIVLAVQFRKILMKEIACCQSLIVQMSLSNIIKNRQEP